MHGRPEFGQVREFGSDRGGHLVADRVSARGEAMGDHLEIRSATVIVPGGLGVGDIETHGLMIDARRSPGNCRTVSTGSAAMAQRLARISARRTWSAGRRGP